MPDHAQARPATPLKVELLPVLRDNYLFVLHDGRRAAVVDPAVAEPAIAWLKQRDLELVAVLQTHHHSDHIGGTPALLAEWPRAEVVAALADRERIPFQTRGWRTAIASPCWASRWRCWRCRATPALTWPSTCPCRGAVLRRHPVRRRLRPAV